MKKFAILSTAMALSIVACAQDVESFSNKKDDHTNVKSYAFVNTPEAPTPIIETEETTITSPADNEDDMVVVTYSDAAYAPESMVEKETIQEALSYELDVRDINYQQDHPDILIQYAIYDGKSAESKNYIRVLEKYKQANSKQQDYIAELDKGAVVLSVIDSKNDQNIWEGYAFNVFNENDNYQQRQHDLRKAVNALMTQYDSDHS